MGNDPDKPDTKPTRSRRPFCDTIGPVFPAPRREERLPGTTFFTSTTMPRAEEQRPTTNRKSPVAVSGLSGGTAVAGGGGHSLAAGGDVDGWGWGRNGYGQVGDGTTTHRKTPVLVPLRNAIKYYFFGGQRIAMRKEGVVYYLLGDHLGTTSVVLCGDQPWCSGVAYGEVVAESRHRPYGEERWSWVAPSVFTFPTDYRFTGQRNEASLGLYHMGARF